MSKGQSMTKAMCNVLSRAILVISILRTREGPQCSWFHTSGDFRNITERRMKHEQTHEPKTKKEQRAQAMSKGQNMSKTMSKGQNLSKELEP